MTAVQLSDEQRAKVERVKADYRAAERSDRNVAVAKIVAMNQLGPEDIALAVLAMHELDEEA